MATAQEYADWLRTNQDKRDTADYKTVLRAFQEARMEELRATREPAAPEAAPETGFVPAARAGFERLKGEAALTAGKLGLMGLKEAEEYRAAREEAAGKIFKPTEEGWTEAPLTKLKELLGQSAPYMVAPIAAAGAAAALPFTGTAAAVAAGLAAGATSAAQFTGSNLARQIEEAEKKGEDASLARAKFGNAVAAAIPQAALDVVSLRGLPLIRNLFKSVGKDLTEAEAKAIAEQTFRKTLADYGRSTLMTAGREGFTEAGQQYLERLQAGLKIADEAARKEYIDSFVGGAVLGGTLAPAGRYFERGGEQTRARAKLQDIQDTQRRAEAEEAERKEAEQAELRKQPEYLRDLQARYTGVRDEEQALKDEIAALKKSGDPADAALAKEKQEGLRDFYRDKFNPVRDEYNKAGGTAFFKKFAEQERVAGMTPEDYMFEQISKEETAATTKEVARLKARLKQVGKDSNEAKFLKARIAQLQPKAAREVTEEDIIGLPPQAAPSPAEQYATQRLKLAEEQMSGMADESDLAEYLLQDRAMARQLVEQGAQLPGLTKQKSKAVLGLVDAQFKADEEARVEADKARLEREAEDLARAQARPEGMTLDEYQAQLREMGYMEPRQEGVQYEARREQRERMTAPVQEQLTLGLEPPPSRGAARAERTITPDGGQRSVVMRDGEVGQDTTSYRYSAEMDGEPVTVRVEKNNLTGAVEAFTEAANRPVGYGMGISKLVKSGMPVEDALKRVAPLDKISLIPYKEAAEAPPVERRMARERELTAPVLIDLLRRGQQAAPTEQIRNVLEGLENNAEALARNKEDAAEVADYVRRMSIAPSQTGVSLQPLQDILAQQEKAKRSETELATQYGRRALTEEEKEKLVGTTLGPRKEIGIIEGDLPKKIADIAQNARQGTPVREATDEILRAAQFELPFTDRRGEAAQRTATAFGDWAEFQRYLGSEGLQMLRAASEDVTNKGIPNAHRANVLIQNLLQKVNGVTGLRARIDDIVQKRNAIMGKSVEDAAQAKELLLRAVAELERNLRLYAPASVPEMIKSIRTAREKLESAQKVRDELLRQMQDNTTSMEALIQAYEQGMALTPVPEEGRVGEQFPLKPAPTFVLGYESANAAARERAAEQARKARDALKAAIDNLLAHQRWIEGAQRDVNFIGPDTPAAEKNFRLKKLNDLLAEEKKLRNAVANANNRFMGLVRRTFARGEKAPTLPDKAFKDFLVQEAKLTDLLNEQRRRVNGLRLGLNNARMRLNNAYVAMENVPETATLRQGLRQQLTDAEALEQETRIDLTRRREEVEKLGLTPSQAVLEKDARELERKADAIKRASQQLAEKRRGAKPEETKADRERRDAEKRREQQAELERREEPVAGKAEEPRGIYAEKPLEARQEEGAPIPRTQVLMEVRRKIRQQVQDKVDKLEALREIAESADSTVDERVEAANEFAELYKDTLGKLEKRDKKLSNALKVHETAVGKAIEIRERLAQESTLTEGQKKRYKNNPEKAAEVEANQRAALNRQLNSLMLGLDKAAAFLSKNRGIERVQMPTKAEKAAQAEGRVYGEDSEVMAPGAERIARTQTTQRQMGPVVRKGTVAPSQLLTGTEESRKGTTATGTRNKPVESRGRVERDVAISKQEQQLANLTAEEIQKRHQEQRAKEAAAIAETLPKTEAELEAQEEEAIETATPSQLKKRKGAKQKKSTMATIEDIYFSTDEDGNELAFSRGATSDPSTTASVRAELGKVFPDLGRVQIYDSVEALIAANPQYKGLIPADARGFVDTAGNKAFLIAENIDKGRALSVLLHEVGAHIGLKNMLGEAQYNALVRAVESWEKRNDGSVEARVAQAARARVEAAETKPSQVNDELLAYAVEEAVNAGVKPMETKGIIGQWLSRIASLFNKALQKFGLSPKKLTADELVNMAFGAAKMEMAPKVPQVSRRQFLRGASAAIGSLKLPPLSKDMKLDALESAWEASMSAARTWFDTAKAAAKTPALKAIVRANNIEDIDNENVATALYEVSPDLYNHLHYLDYGFSGETEADYRYYTRSYLEDKGVKAVAELQQALKSMYQNVLQEVKGTQTPEVGELFFSKQPKYNPALANAGRIADQTISERPGFFAKLKENMLGMGFRTQFIDALAPLEAVAGRMGDAVKSMQMMYYLRMYGYRMHLTSEAIDSGVPQLVKKMRRDGTPEWVIEAVEGANIKDIVKTLSAKDVIKAAGSADAANRLFTLYLAKLRADNKGYDALNFGRAAAEAELKEIERDLASDKVSSEDKARMRQRQAHLNKVKNTLPTEADIKAAFAEIQANPVLRDAFAVARDQYNAYNQDLLRFMVQAGAMSKAEAERLLKNKDYIPYYRVRDGVAQLMIGGETPVRIGNLKDSPHLQELVGGEEPIFSFLDSSVQNTSMLIDMAMRNIAVKNAMWEMGKMGYAKLKKAGKAGAPKGAVEFKVDGEDWYALVDTEHIGIPSDLLVKGLAGVPTMLPAAVEMMGVPARFLRRAVTASPVYAFRQLMRDSTAAYISSGSNELPMLGALRQIGKASAIQRRGVTGGQVFTGMPEDMARLLREMQEGRPGWSKAFSKLEALSMEADALTRRSQYESYIKQGLSEMEATMMTIESMNFMRRGLSPSMHMVTSLIPFMNAQIQSLDVLYRSFRGQMPFNERLAIREKLIARGMMLAGMSIMYALAMQDDKDYKNAKPDEKYNNWFVKIPGIEEPMRIPIPFELGYIFKALPEAIINTMYAERGADEAKDAALGILRNLIPGGSNYLVPQAVKPLIEVGLGKSFYTGRDIETSSEQQQEPWARYRQTTSGAAKFLGELFNVSPVKLESLVSGYTGSMGLALLQATNFIFPTPESAPAEKRLSEMPVIGTLFQPKDATGIINDTFDRLKEATEAKNTYNDLIKRGELKKAEAYLAQNANRIALASLAGDFRQQIGELTTAEREIRGAKISPAEKREVLDALRQSKILVASSVRAALGGTELR